MYATQKNINNVKPTINQNTVCNKYLQYPNESGKRIFESGLRKEGKYKHSRKEKPLITIITVVYNNEKTLERCIKSVLEQTYDNIEYIIIDGASDDNTLKIVTKYEKSIDYCISEPDNGIYSAMNKGLSLANGDYIIFLNSDDWFLKNAISLSLKNILDHQLDLSYAGFQYANQSGKCIIADEGRAWNDSMLILGIAGGHETILATQEAYNSVGIYDETFSIAADYDWTIRAYKKGLKAKLLHRNILIMELGGASFNVEKEKEENYRILKSNFPEIDIHTINKLYELKYYRNWYKLSLTDAEIEKLLQESNNHSEQYKNALSLTIKYLKEPRIGKVVPNINKSKANKLNICIALTYFTDTVGGAEKIAIETANELNRRGHAVTIVSCHGVAGEPYFPLNMEIPYIDLAVDPYRNFYITQTDDNFNLIWRYDNFTCRNYPELEYSLTAKDFDEWSVQHVDKVKLYRSFLKQYDFDVVISHMPSTFPYTLLAKNENSNTLHIAALHSVPRIKFYSDAYPAHNITDRYMRLVSLEKADLITVLFNEFKSHMPNQYRDKTYAIPNFINQEKIQHNTLKEKEKIILAVGRLSEQKNYPILLEAYSKIIKKHPDWSLHIYGEGPLAPALRKKCVELNLSYEQIFKGRKQNLEEVYQQASIFAAPSLYEGFMLTLVEAMYHHLPAIAFQDSEGPQYIIDHNVNGLLIPRTNNEEFFTSALIKLINSSSLREELGNNAAIKALDYSLEKIVDSLEDLIYSKSKKTPTQLNKIHKENNKKLSITQICTSTSGGAGIACYRLHCGLIDIQNVDAKLITNPIAKNFETDFTQISRNNRYPGNTIFSLSYPSLTFDNLKTIIENNDIINLHWVQGMVSTEALAYLSHSNKPIVWTFHDINPLTGGCHYFHGCENWKTDCMNCPQLIDNYNNYPAKILAAKKKYINFKNITVVVLNKHFKTLVEKSPLFNESRIEIIPNSIDTNKFKPLDKNKTRYKLGLYKNKKYLLYVADYASSIKGYKEFEQTVEEYEKLFNTENIEILLVGNLPNDRNIKLPFKEFGHVDEEKIIELYNASNVTVLSSIEDNLPNVILESFSCGTPVVGFKVGGLPDLIKNDYNGYTVNLGDVKGLANAIHKVLVGKDLSKNCRKYTEKNLKLDIQSKRYKILYDEILDKPIKITKKQNLIPEIFPETTSTVINFFNESILMKNKLLEERQTLINVKNKSLKEKHTIIADLATIRDTQKEKLNSLENENMILLEELYLIRTELKQKKSRVSLSVNDRWHRFTNLSGKRKLWTIGKVISKKLKIYSVLQPIAKSMKKIVKKYI